MVEAKLKFPVQWCHQGSPANPYYKSDFSSTHIHHISAVFTVRAGDRTERTGSILLDFRSSNISHKVTFYHKVTPTCYKREREMIDVISDVRP